MINLGNAPKQREMVAGPIPATSMVRVKLEIREPKKADPNDEAVTVFSSGLKGLDLEFTVTDGRFEGLHIWENWFLPPEMQDISLTKGQKGACQGGVAKCRAAIEAARNLDPDDPAGNRNIESWLDLHGLEIPVRVGIDKPKRGDQYINNNISKVLTVKDRDFENIMGGGEVISDEPVPEIPERKEKNGNGDGPKGWGQTNQEQNQKSPKKDGQSQPQQQKVNSPTWSLRDKK